MAYLILFLMACAWWSYFWEAGLAPTLRAWLRWDIFAVRDRLRDARIDMGECVPKAVYDELQHSINWSISNLDELNIWDLYRASKALRDDEDLRARVAERTALLDSCQLEEIGSIRWQLGRLYMAAFAVNAGGWAILLVPVLVCAALWNRFKALVKALLVFPTSTLDRIFESKDHASLSH